MRLYSKALLGGVAALALGGYTAGAANAMDKTDWRWNLLIDTYIHEDININVDIDPVGKVLDEVFQMQIGDVSAESSISHVYNLKPLEEFTYTVGYEKDYSLTVDEGYENLHGGSGSGYRRASGAYGSSHEWEKTLGVELKTASRSDHPAGFIGGAGAVVFGGSIPPGTGFIAGGGVIGAIGAAAWDGDASFDLTVDGSSSHDGSWYKNSRYAYGYDHSSYADNYSYVDIYETNLVTVTELAPALQNALNELPKVESIATAAGNIVSIESDTAVQEHSLQVVFDDVDSRCHHRGEGPQSVQGEHSGCHGRVDFDDADFDLDADLGLQDKLYDLDTDNYNHDVALLLGLAAGAGLIEQADISASSSASHILNAQVESTASAFGNVKSIDVKTDYNQNGLVMADITQLSVANVSANATAYDIKLVNYNHLGKLDDAIASATATAIGNVVNIKVDSGQSTSYPTP